ncbi:hypothetical protein, partial [Myxococcus sp. CA039A]|uniref:hypothetical protein n=1 Tax=Myxococcus sp. CA039A TaxID=2741737 RepID=UPI001C2D57A0
LGDSRRRLLRGGRGREPWAEGRALPHWWNVDTHLLQEVTVHFVGGSAPSDAWGARPWTDVEARRFALEVGS